VAILKFIANVSRAPTSRRIWLYARSPLFDNSVAVGEYTPSRTRHKTICFFVFTSFSTMDTATLARPSTFTFAVSGRSRSLVFSEIICLVR
jgi:hypothetical protein